MQVVAYNLTLLTFHLRVGKIKFDSCNIRKMQDTCLLSVNFERDCLIITVFSDIYADDDTVLVLAFKLILLYFHNN